MLKDAATKAPAGAGEQTLQDADVAHGNQTCSLAAGAAAGDNVFRDTVYLAPGDGNVFTSPMSWDFDNNHISNGQGMPFSLPDMSYKSRAGNPGATSWELLGMGMFEALPPTEMIEELSVCALPRELGSHCLSVPVRCA